MIYSEIKYQDERSKTYVGSPSVIRLPDGALLATHDFFGNIKNIENECGLTAVYRSEDDGKTWQNITYIVGAFWGNLFMHRDKLYFLSTSQEFGDVVLRESLDGGFTWSVPYDEEHGVLLKAGSGHTMPNYHMAPTPVIVHNNRIWKAMENLFTDGTQPEWRPYRFRPFILSAHEDADLMKASSWQCSNELIFEHNDFKDQDFIGTNSGWLEGNIVAYPDGSLHDVMRVHLYPPNKAVVLDVSPDGKKLTCDYANCFTDFVGGWSKFTLRRDPVSGCYFTVSNYIETDEKGEALTHRNLLALGVSKDMHHWKMVKKLVWDESGLEPDMSAKLHGFQYADWQFDGDNIVYVVRTAYRGARNYHDSNRITFHVLENFRKYIPADMK